MAANYVGSSGTLISAALETLGYYYQSYLLDVLSDPFHSAVGTAIYLCAIVAGIGSFVLTGRYKLGAWLLIGPSLFFAVLFERTETAGVQWRFGDQAKSQVAVQDSVAHVKAEWWDKAPQQMAGLPKVATLFARYDGFVSDIVSQSVKLLNAGRKDLDTKFLVRTQLMYSLHDTEIDNPALRALVHQAFLGECREVVEVGRQLQDVTIGDDAKAKLRDRFIALNQRKSVKFNDTTIAYVAQIAADFQGEITDDLGEIPSWMINDGNQSSQKIDAWLEKVRRLEEQRKLNGNQPQNSADKEAIKRRVTSMLQGSTFACQEVWQYTYALLWIYAKRAFDETLNTAESKGIKPLDMIRDLRLAEGFDRPKLRDGEIIGDQNGDQISYEENLKEYADYLDDGDAEEIKDADLKIWQTNRQSKGLDEFYKLLAKYILRNEIRQRPLSTFLSKFSKRGNEYTGVGMPGEGDLSFQERKRMQVLEWQEKTRFFTTMTQLPYYQGLALFFLAITYPFFALLLLIPGKQSGFVHWFLLWAWIKSWDVGFVVAMMLEDLLFVMTNKDWTKGGKAPMIMDADLTTTLTALQEADPSLQPTIMYLIVGTVLGATPILMSYAVMGLARGGSGMIAEGVKVYGELFAKRAGMTQGQELITGSRLEAQEGQLNRATNYRVAYENGTSRYKGYQDPTVNLDLVQSGVERSDSAEGKSGKEQLSSVQTSYAVGGALEGISSSGKFVSNDTMAGAQVDDGAMPPSSGSDKGAGYSKVAGAIQTVAGSGATIAIQSGKSSLSYYKADIEKAVGWAKYDEINDARSQFLAGVARIGYMFEIPWTESGAYSSEFSYRLNLIEQKYEKQNSYWEAGGNLGKLAN